MKTLALFGPLLLLRGCSGDPFGIAAAQQIESAGQIEIAKQQAEIARQQTLALIATSSGNNATAVAIIMVVATVIVVLAAISLMVWLRTKEIEAQREQGPRRLPARVVYVQLPGPGPAPAQLAGQWYDDGVWLDLVEGETALVPYDQQATEPRRRLYG